MSTFDRSTLGLGVGSAVELPVAQPAAQQVPQSAPATEPTPVTALAGAEATRVPEPTRQPPGRGPQLGNELQAMIGRQLSAIYHEVLNEPVPDRFVRLLEELASKDASNS